MDIDYLEDNFGAYFRNKRGIYVIQPGSVSQASNIHKVFEKQKDAGGDVSANLTKNRPLYKVGLAGKPKSSTGILGRLKDYQTAYPNGFQVIALLVKKEENLEYSEKQIFKFLENEKVMYRRVGKRMHPGSGRTEWTGATLNTLLAKLQEYHEASRSGQSYHWKFSAKDAVLQNTKKKGKLLSSVDMNRIRDKPLGKNKDAAYGGSGTPHPT